MDKFNNLTPWRKGQSGNPGGRPKDDLARQIARGNFERHSDLVESTILNGLRKGDARTLQWLGDRAFGKVQDRVEVTNADPPVTLTVAEINARLERLLGHVKEGDTP